jgi:hypothetical protein
MCIYLNDWIESGKTSDGKTSYKMFTNTNKAGYWQFMYTFVLKDIKQLPIYPDIYEIELARIKETEYQFKQKRWKLQNVVYYNIKHKMKNRKRKLNNIQIQQKKLKKQLMNEIKIST